MSVYIDLVFFVNFIFDAEILFVLLKICSKKIILWRILLASLMGGIQGVLFFIPYFRVLSVSPLGILMPIIFIVISLYPCDVKECAISYIIYLVIASVFSGIINLFGLKISLGMLTFLPICFALKILRNHIFEKKKRIKVFYGGRCIEKDAIYDSANRAFYLGNPVIFGSKQVFSEIFGMSVDEKNIWDLAQDKDVCLIPYKTVDNSGIVVGIRLERAIVDRKEYKRIILALFENSLETEIILNSIMV